MNRALRPLFLGAYWLLVINLVNGQIATDTTFYQQGVISNFPSLPAFATYDYNAYFFGGQSQGVETSAASYVDISGIVGTTALTSLPQARSGACAVVDSVGNFYIIGGDTLGDGSGTTTLLKYNAGGDIYTSTLKPMNTVTRFSRCVYDATTERIYVVGGVLATPATVLTAFAIYDIVNDQWSSGTNIPSQISYFQLAVTSQGLYLLGGAASNGLPSTLVYKYDFNGNAWTLMPGLNTAQAYAGTVVSGDQIILLSGKTGVCQYYNTTDNVAVTINCNGLPGINQVSLATLLGPNLYVIEFDGTVYRADCAVNNCLYGCASGNCQQPSPTPPVAEPLSPPVNAPVNTPVSPPLTAAPFSECAQCQSPTPYCVPSRQICVGNRVVPILQCVTEEGRLMRAHFAYDNRANVSFALSAGFTTHYLLPSGTPNQLFEVGRPDFYPLAAFTADYERNLAVEWFVDGYLLQFNTSTAPLCPVNITFAIFVTPLQQDFNSFWTNLQAILARAMNIVPGQLAGRLIANKRDLEEEIEVSVSPSEQSSDPSPADVVASFIGNATTIEAVKSEVPEVLEVVGKKSPGELTGQAVPSNLNQAPSAVPTLVPVKVSSAINTTTRVAWLVCVVLVHVLIVM